jgi:hypothetical protein
VIGGGRVTDDLVVHVGDVHDVIELEAAGAQPFAQDVQKGEGAEITDVGVIVDGGAAGVHADDVVARGREFLDLLRERVVESQRHSVWGILIVAERA